MFSSLIFAGKIRWIYRPRLILRALRVLWYAIRGWEMAGWR